MKEHFIVQWHFFPVLFCEGLECRHVYSLVDEAEATRFDRPAAAAQMAREYGLRSGDYEILRITEQTKRKD